MKATGEQGGEMGRIGLSGQVEATVRRGISGDKLVFGGVCAVAVAIAGVTLVLSVGSGRDHTYSGDWQCLECGHHFTSETLRPPPTDCPKCGKEAVKLLHKKCLWCGKDVLVCKTRMTTKSQEILAAYYSENPGEAEGNRLPRIILHLLMEARYRVREPDGEYRWHDEWVADGSAQAEEIRSNIHCPECGEALFGPQRD